MFPLLAAKGGTVHYAKDTCSNGSTGCTNILSSKTSPPARLPTRSTITWPIAVSLQLCTRWERVFPRDSLLVRWMIPDTAQVTTCISWCIPVPIVIGVHRWISPSGMCPSIGMLPPRADARAPRRESPSLVESGKAVYIRQCGCQSAHRRFDATGRQTDGHQPVLATSGWGSDNLGVTRMQLLAYYENAWHEVGAPQTTNPFQLQPGCLQCRHPSRTF